MFYKNIYTREKYLIRLRPFYHSDIIKIITGIRRCGKSTILKTIMNELQEKGVKESNIVYLPLDRRGFKNIKSPEQLEEKIESFLKQDEQYYIFVDEVQNVKGFESVIQAYAEEGYSIFLTGSNSYLLSDEISTKLTGRYINFETYPLDFKEYIEMKTFFKQKINENIDDEFNEYILNGGFPKSVEFNENSARRLYTQEIIHEIFVKDVKSRNRITNLALFERVESYLINNYASPFSISNFMNELAKLNITAKSNTVRNYIEELKKAKIIYECNRFDLKSKKAIKREQKYYLADLSIYFSTNVDNRLNYGPSLENMVYIYLISNGYQVSIGKIGNFECDFVVRDQENKYAYVQVTYSLHGENNEATEKIKQREYRPFRNIKDGYPRYIVSLDKYLDQQEGVHHINAIDLFLGKVRIL